MPAMSLAAMATPRNPNTRLFGHADRVYLELVVNPNRYAWRNSGGVDDVSMGVDEPSHER